MGTPVNRGGKEVVTAGFPPNAHNELKKRILKLGRLLMPKELGLIISLDSTSEPMLPAKVVLSPHTFDHGDPQDGDYTIGIMGVELTMQLGFSKAKNPRHAELLGGTAVVSTVEPYVQGPYGNEELELWTSRGVGLQQRSRRIKFWHETTIRNEEGDRVAVLDQPPSPGGRAQGADPAWLAARALTQGTNVDYHWMISGLDAMIADRGPLEDDE